MNFDMQQNNTSNILDKINNSRAISITNNYITLIGNINTSFNSYHFKVSNTDFTRICVPTHELAQKFINELNNL
jgi:hypothetical protein